MCPLRTTARRIFFQQETRRVSPASFCRYGVVGGPWRVGSGNQRQWPLGLAPGLRRGRWIDLGKTSETGENEIVSMITGVSSVGCCMGSSATAFLDPADIAGLRISSSGCI
jgi:hypothetical protein